MLKQALVFSFAFFQLINWSYSRAETNEGSNNPTEITETTITGRVKFELRSDRISETACVDLPCHHSRKYWSMVIYSGNSKYLLNMKFDIGRPDAPEAIEVMGVILSPDSEVEVEGPVVWDGPGFFTLLRVRSVTVLGN